MYNLLLFHRQILTSSTSNGLGGIHGPEIYPSIITCFFFPELDRWNCLFWFLYYSNYRSLNIVSDSVHVVGIFSAIETVLIIFKSWYAPNTTWTIVYDRKPQLSFVYYSTCPHSNLSVKSRLLIILQALLKIIRAEA